MTDKLGILLYEKVQPIDVIGPWEVFSIWKCVLQPPMEMFLVSEHGSLIDCDSDIKLKAHCDFKNAPKLDYLIVPGGRGRRDQVHNENLIKFIQEQAKNCKYILSVCTGMFLLQKAGLLNEKSATSYWRALPEFKEFADIQVVEDRIVKSGKIWTSGGMSSGIDLAFELIAEIAGKETAGKVQLLFEYFPRDTIYSTEEMIESLPPYHSKKEPKPYLPSYIKKYIASKRKTKKRT